MKGQSKGLPVFTLQAVSEAETIGLYMLRKRLAVHSAAVFGRNQERVCFFLPCFFSLFSVQLRCVEHDMCGAIVITNYIGFVKQLHSAAAFDEREVVFPPRL